MFSIANSIHRKDTIMTESDHRQSGKLTRQFRLELSKNISPEAHESPEVPEVEESNPTSRSRGFSCALSVSRPCCKGLGFNLGIEGSYAFATLCRCVTTCPICMGKTILVDKGFARDCRQPSPRRIVDAINTAKIPARYAQASLESFDNTTGNCPEIVEVLKKWVREFKPIGSKGIVLSGPVGVGKTFLLASLAKVLAFRTFSVKFVDFFQLLSEIRAGYAGGQSESDLLQPLIRADVLIIDELGKGRNNDFELTVLDQLVMGRYNQKKTIIASTNYSLKEKPSNAQYNVDLDQDYGRRGGFAPEAFDSLESRVGNRILSRFYEIAHFVELTGDDYRKKKTP